MTLIKRAISSWISAALLLLLFSGKTGKAITVSKELISPSELPLLLLLTVFIFATLCGISAIYKNRPTDDVVLGAVIGAYALALSFMSNSIAVVLPVFAALAISAFYLFCREDRTLPSLAVSTKAGVAVMIASAFAMALFIGSITAARYLTFASPNYDFGIFCNMFESMATDLTQTVSSEREEIIQHFQVHFSPVYYLMLPVYMIFRSPVTLQILQALIVASGAVPLYLAARRRSLSPRASALLTFVYALFPALSGGCMYDLHENCFLAPFLLWLFYGYERRDKLGTVLTYLFAVLTLTVKEDAAVYVAFVGIYMMIADGHDRGENPTPSDEDRSKNIFKRITDGASRFLTEGRRNGLVLILVSVAWFCLTSWYLNSYGYGVMSNRYDNFISGDEGLVGVIRTVLVNPALVFSEMLEAEKLTFLAQILLPLAALPLVTRRPHRLVLLFPLILINLMSDYQYQHSITFQYVFGTSAFLFYASAVNLSDLPAKFRRALLVLAAASSVVFFSAFVSPYVRYVKSYAASHDYYASIEETLSEIPSDASVTSSTFYLPHLADRREIYQLKDGAELAANTDYVVFDLRYTEKGKIPEYKKSYLTRGYEVFDETQSVLILVRQTAQETEISK